MNRIECKQATILLLVLVLLFAVIFQTVAPALAQTAVVAEGSIGRLTESQDFAGGTGTAEDPYLVATAEQLDDVRNYLDAHFRQTADIYLGVEPWNTGEGWRPIGTLQTDDPFNGSYNGGGYAISGLTINRPGQFGIGLFGYVGVAGTVQDVHLDGSSVAGGDNAGSLAGYNDGSVITSYATGTVNGGISVGGLVGDNSGIVTASYATGTVNGSYFTGGLIGRNSGTVTDSYSFGAVTGSASHTGGLIGYNIGGIVMESHATGAVNGYENAGGLVGYNESSTITGSYASGPVTGNLYIGGLVGFNRDSTVMNSYATGSVTGSSAYVGGLMGYNNGTVTNSYSTGPVTGNSYYVGGLVGSNSGKTTGCYWDTQTSEQATSAGGEGRTTDQMTYPYEGATTYVGWDFANIWAADITFLRNNGYPVLQAILTPLIEILSPVRSGTLVVGSPLRFSGAEPGVAGIEYHWDFGDGRHSAVSSPGLVSFPATGDFEVTYAIFASGGQELDSDHRTYTVVENTGNMPDLQVTGVQVPPFPAVGQPIEIRYSVSNVGQGSAASAWGDAVFLSKDAYLDVRDQLLGSAAVNLDLAAGESYQNTITVTLPTVEEGAYHLIVTANEEWLFPELQRLNNEYAAPIMAQIPLLEDGIAYPVAYSAGRVEQCYRMVATGDQSLLMNLAGAASGLEVYVRYNSLPTRATYDYHLDSDLLVIPAAVDGNWYILVYGYMAETGVYTLRYDMRQLVLAGSSPSRYGTTGDIVLALTGAGFIDPLDVALDSGLGKVYEAPDVEVDSFEQAIAIFPAGTVPAGTYSVRVSRSGESAELPGALEIIQGGTPNLEVNLVLPAQLGYHNLATFYVEYANTGDAPMPAPLLQVTAYQKGQPGAIITLDESLVYLGFYTSAMPEGFANSVQFLASGESPGTLQPGESRRVPIYYAGWQPPWDFSYPPIEWSVGVLGVDNTIPADWAAQKDTLRSEYVREDAWEVLWDNFTTLAGETWGSYLAMLDRNIMYLQRQGVSVNEVNPLLDLSFRHADGLSPVVELAGGNDSDLQAPGLSIVFTRSYLQEISRRFELGPVGRGWTHNWQIALSTREDDTVIITNQTGTPRIFQPDSRYPGGYLAQSGDKGVLLAVAEGYRLTEADGIVQLFTSDGNLGYVEDTNGNRITCAYSAGRLSSLAHSSGPALAIAYNNDGRITSVTDHQGRQTRYTYSGEYLASVQAYDGRVWSYSYITASGASQHALHMIGLPDGATRTYTYDEHGWLNSTYINNGKESISFSYPGEGQVDVTDNLGNVSHYFFDHWGRLVKAENALGEVVQINFNETGNLAAVTDPDGFSTTFTYDLRGNLITSTDAMRHATQFAYTLNLNRLAAVTDTLGNRTGYSYDARGNLTVITYPDRSAERWDYDPKGSPTTWTNRRDIPIAYQYNAEGRVTRKTYADTGEVTYRYDERGNLVEARDANGMTVFAYAENDRLARIDYPGGRWLEFTYDEAGRRAASLDQTGHRLDYHYDPEGRLERMTDETETVIVRYQYDAVGRLSQKTVGSGVYTDYDYDAAGQLVSLVNRAPDTTIISRFAYTYDRRGRRTAMDTHYGAWTYEYDSAGQLTRAVLVSSASDIPNQDLVYTYDALGNRIRATVNGVEEEYTTNHLNQYTQIGDHTYTYDLDGNLTEEAGPDGVTVYTYNDENRLVSVTRGADTWEYTYDALGNRVAVSANEIVTHYIVDPVGLGNVIGEYSAGGDVVAHYDHGLGLLNRIDTAGTAVYYTFDAIGNVSELTDSANIIRNAYVYRPFGETLRHGSSIPNLFEYVGQWGVMYEQNELNYMRARFYASNLGKFVSIDPVKAAVGHPYQYTKNSPLQTIDPDGLSEKRISDILRTVRDFVVDFVIGFYTGPLSGEIATVPLILERIDEMMGGNGEAYIKLRDGLQHIRGRAEYYENIYAHLPDLPTSSLTKGTTGTVGPTDPNEKTGPAGYGEENYVAAERSLAYRVDFENLGTASAPAQVVTIRDPLSDGLDLSTFDLTEIGFGDILVAIPPGRQYYQTVIDYDYSDDEYNFILKVYVEACLENGVVYVNFFSIDPETGLPPQDVNVGFLLPENETGRGQGHISYLVRPKPDQPSGIEIRNIASIQFDFGLQIDTNQVDPLDPGQGTDPDKEALVTIDSQPPTSRVTSLPAITSSPSFTVSWSGEDELGSGIARYDIYAQDNAGVWALWQANVTAPSATFTGVDGHTYAFYAVATDHVGYRESKEAQVEAFTTINWVTENNSIYLPLVLRKQ